MTVTTTSKSKTTTQETANKIKSLLKNDAKAVEDRAESARLDELRQIFAGLIQDGDLQFGSVNQKRGAAQEKWNHWLTQQHQKLVKQLMERIVLGRRTAVRTLWGLVAASPQLTASGTCHVNSDLLGQWLQALVQMPIDVTHDKSMHHLLEAEVRQRDVQYYAMRAMAGWAKAQYQKQTKKQKSNDDDDQQNNMSAEQCDRMVRILMMVPFPRTQAEIDSTSSTYLFPPPNQTPSTKGGKGRRNDDEDASCDSDHSSDGEDDSSNESEEDNNNSSRPPKKKQKTSSKQQFAFQDIQNHRNALSKAWMAMLRLPISSQQMKQVLPFLSIQVLPNVSEPLRFSDFYMQAYSGAALSDNTTSNTSTIIPMLALEGLFFLMTEHRLEYPDFYKQLYKLVEPKVFYVKYRLKFFRLLQKCLLRNEMLPSHIVAAFLKRLLQCALKVPPPSCLFILGLVSNLLRQHDECAGLIHKSQSTQEMDDPFDADTNDPVECRALQSSLWELLALERHYHPAVATLAQSIGREDPKTPMLQLDELAQHSYVSLMEQERKRKLKKQPKSSNNKRHHDRAMTPVTFLAPTGLFSPKDDVLGGVLKLPTTTTTET